MGYCKYCGQSVADTETDEEATKECMCYEAECGRKRTKAATEAKGIIEQMFGAPCAAAKLVPLHEDILRALCSVVDLIGEGEISKVSFDIPGICTVKLTLTGYAIKVERGEKKKYSNVAGTQ